MKVEWVSVQIHESQQTERKITLECIRFMPFDVHKYYGRCALKINRIASM